jgi:hypothetical protein
MTNGTKVTDTRYMTSGNWQRCLTQGSVPQRVGRLITKTWSGADSPNSQVAPFTFKLFEYRVWKWNAKKARWQVGTRRRRVKVPTGAPRAPKTENAYNCVITDSTDGIFVITDPTTVCTNGRTVYDQVSTETYGVAFRPESAIWSPNQTLALIGKLSNRLQGDSFNMAVFLGEGKDALNTITQAATRIRRALIDLRHGSVPHAIEALLGDRLRHSSQKSKKQMSDEYVGSNWLQLQYGWKPLLSDVYGAAGHLAYMQNRPQILTYRASQRIQGDYSSSAGGVTNSGTYFVGKTIKALVEHINEASLVGLSDPASLAWELLPYSFVIDWFIPIGNYLQQLNFAQSLKGKYVTSSLMVQNNTSTRLQQTFARGLATYSHREVRASRSVSSSLAVPMPSIKPFSKIATWVHATNALALLSQLNNPSRDDGVRPFTYIPFRKGRG